MHGVQRAIAMVGAVALLGVLAAAAPMTSSAAPAPHLAAGAVLEVPVGGVGGVPVDAVAAVVNFTVTNPAAVGYVTVYPCGVTRPTASNLNFVAGETVANLVVARLGVGGRVCVYSWVATDVLADVSGYFPAGSGYAPIDNPTRILDTRSGVAGSRLAAGAVLELPVGGVGGVPADAAAAAVNFTVTNPAAAGFVTVYPCGVARPTASNLNFAAGETVANLVVTKLGAGGRVCVYSSVSTDVLADVSGYFPAGSGYVPIPNPTRILDTRLAFPVSRLAAGAVLELPVGGVGGVPADAVAAVVNFTVTNPAAVGYVTVYPCGAPRPEASNLNYVDGQTVANLVVAKLGAGGRVCVYSYAATEVIADVSGYFPAGSGYVPIANPTRILDTRTGLPGSAGCGLVGVAFCESLGLVSGGGRDGDLGSSRWSVSRSVGELSGTDLMPFPSTPVGACKAGVSSVVADNDVLVCDAASGHQGQMLTALGAQNYGLLSMRPRQVFDFGGRTGTVAYNVDAVTQGGLSWWTSLFVTDDPTAGVSDSAQVLGLLPRNGIGINFDDSCGTVDASKVKVGSVFVYSNYVESRLNTSGSPCVSTRRGSLNHVEVRLSQSSVEVWASNYSTDGGVSFPGLQRIFSAPISLSFSRGYVHFQQAQRAPLKYTSQFGISPTYANNYWSQLGFDGPVIAGETGYAVADALSVNPNSGAMNIGYALWNNPYRATKCCSGSAQIPLDSFSVPGVEVAGLTSAELSFAVNYTYTGAASPSTVALRYSLNGGPWRSPNPAPNYVAEGVCGSCPGPSGGNGVLFNFPVPLSDLHAGTNTIAFASDNTENSWPPVLTSLELITHR